MSNNMSSGAALAMLNPCEEIGANEEVVDQIIQRQMTKSFNR